MSESDRKKEIGLQIKQARKDSGMTQKELADVLGVSMQEVSKYEGGKKNLTIETMQRIATALKVTFTIPPAGE